MTKKVVIVPLGNELFNFRSKICTIILEIYLPNITFADMALDLCVCGLGWHVAWLGWHVFKDNDTDCPVSTAPITVITF